MSDRVVGPRVTETITEEKMLEFYKSLNVIDFKYNLGAENLGDEEYVEKYAEIERIEDCFQFAELTKVEYGDILPNLDLIYAREDKSDQIVELFDLIRNKIIHQYIGIEGLERMFSEKYIDFEWEMHLGIDYKSHRMKFYRDHFIHQIRNAYCIHILLEKFGWKQHMAEILLDRKNSKISRYVCKNIEQQKVRGYYYGDELLSEYNTEVFYCRNIIYMACYMAALFHDIGYPEVTNAMNQKRITEYIPNLYNAENTGYNYSRLNALLQNSLLFRLVSFTEIQQRISGEKEDHGALSAIIFLLNFYENGAIHGLMPFKRCAVELAALAIYNHTNVYRYKNKLKDGEYVRNQFVLNPISYMLRICDDLQEWGRIYFELSNTSNLIICSKCKTPIIRNKEKDSKNILYKCNCKESVFSPLFDYEDNFPYRRIYNVTVCEELNMEQDGRCLCFNVNYRLDRLLHIAYIDPNFAKYRADELNKLKRMFDYQTGLPSMKLEYFVSANPILIKVQIIKEYFARKQDANFKELFDMAQMVDKEDEGTEKEKVKHEWQTKYESVLEDMKTEIFNFSNMIYKANRPNATDGSLIRSCVEHSIELYTKLFVFMELHMRYNQSLQKTMPFIEEKEHETFLSDAMRDQCGEDLYELVKDCIKQFARMYADIREIAVNPEAYYCQFESSNYTYGCIQRFTAPQRYVPIRDDRTRYIDAYTDLALFQKLFELMF